MTTTTSDAGSGGVTRRATLAAAAGLFTAGVLPRRAAAIEPNTGPKVFMDYTQKELDRAYDQSKWAPNLRYVVRRDALHANVVRARLGEPRRFAYGDSPVEMLDLYPARTARAPAMIYIHGGAWRAGTARRYGYLAETFVRAGASFIALDFGVVMKIGLDGMVGQVRKAVAWIHQNAAELGIDPARIHVSGHSSGGHLAGCVLVTDWRKDYGVPADVVKSGTCISGMYDLRPVRLSARSKYVKFDDHIENEYSSQRHLDRLNCPVIVGYGTLETPEFQRQNREFGAALKARGRLGRLIVGEGFNHFEFVETLANPYSVLAEAVLKQMKLG